MKSRRPSSTERHARSQGAAPCSAFVEYEGRVHLLNGVEFTMCGDAFDAYGSEDAPEREFMGTRQRTVTCEKCADVVLACRGVRVRLGPPNKKLCNPPGSGASPKPETLRWG